MVITSVCVSGFGGKMGVITGPSQPPPGLAIWVPAIRTSPVIVFITTPAGVCP